MAMSAFEGEFDIMARLEAEVLLSKTREGIIEGAYNRLDEAMMLEAEAGEVPAVYFWHDEDDDDTLVIMLTRDGVFPFTEETDTKEQIIIKLTGKDLTKVYFEHVKDGERNTFELSSDNFSVIYENPDELDEGAILEPTIEDLQLVELPVSPMSEMNRLSILREKIRRFELTRRA